MTTPILLLGDAHGETEAQFGAPLIGASGIELIRMLSESGLLTLSPVDRDLLSHYYRTSNPKHLISLWAQHPEIARTNVFNRQPPGNDLAHFLGAKSDGIPGYPLLKLPTTRYKPPGNFVRAEFAPELDRLGDEILAHDPNLIVCLGNVALWALTGETGVGRLRGTTLLSTLTATGYKLLPTYHPATILRSYDNRPVVIADLRKARTESTFPDLRRPRREIYIEPSLDDVREFLETHCRNGSLISVDIETNGDRVTCIGFAPAGDLAIVIPFDDSRSANGSYWPDGRSEVACWRLVKDLLEDDRVPKLFQNGAYDITFLWRSMKIRVRGAAEDTMLLHHALQPEALKSLGFLGSIYANDLAWKGMHKAKGIKRND